MATPKEYINSILKAVKEIATLEKKHPLIPIFPLFPFSREIKLLKNLDTEAWKTLEALKEIIAEG